MQWHPFSYQDKAATRPPDDWKLYWIIEQFYADGMPDLGYFDGFTWRMWSGSDDCSVTWWAELARPEPPQDAMPPAEIKA